MPSAFFSMVYWGCSLVSQEPVPARTSFLWWINVTTEALLYLIEYLKLQYTVLCWNPKDCKIILVTTHTRSFCSASANYIRPVALSQYSYSSGAAAPPLRFESTNMKWLDSELCHSLSLSGGAEMNGYCGKVLADCICSNCYGAQCN